MCVKIKAFHNVVKDSQMILLRRKEQTKECEVGSLVGDGDGDAVVVTDGGSHGSDARHQAGHHRAATRSLQLDAVPDNKWP